MSPAVGYGHAMFKFTFMFDYERTDASWALILSPPITLFDRARTKSCSIAYCNYLCISMELIHVDVEILGESYN